MEKDNLIDCSMIKVEPVELSEEDESCSSIISDDNCDLHHLCRVCAKPSEHMVNIFSPEGIQQQLQEKIRNFLPIQVKEDDTLPLQVCLLCTNHLEASQLLAQVCAVADITLRRFHLKPENYKVAESPILVTNTNYSDIEYFSEFEKDWPRTSSDVETIGSQDYDLESEHSANLSVLSSDMETFGSQDYESTTLVSINAPSSDVETIGSQDYQLDSAFSASLDALSSDVETIGSQEFEVQVERHKRSKKYITNNARKRNKQQHTTYSIYQEEGDLPCTMCDLLFLNFMQLKEHYLNVHQMKGCGNCEDVFSNNEELNVHLQREHPFLITCRCCNEFFYTEKLLELHFSTIHPMTKAFFCDLCSNVFKTSAELSNHQFKKHIQTFLCKFCNSGFCSVQVLHQHIIKFHTGRQKVTKTKYSCDNCNNKFKSKISMRNHMLRSHMENVCMY